MATPPARPRQRDIVCTDCGEVLTRLTIPVVPESPEVRVETGRRFTESIVAHGRRCSGLMFRALDVVDIPVQPEDGNDAPA
jgi:hypothetical protein